jgi:hypothetical protein
MSVPFPYCLAAQERLPAFQDAWSFGFLSLSGRVGNTDFCCPFSGSLESDSFVSRNEVPDVSGDPAPVAPESLLADVIRSRGEMVPVEGADARAPASSGGSDVTTPETEILDDVGLAPRALLSKSSDGRQSSSIA